MAFVQLSVTLCFLSYLFKGYPISLWKLSLSILVIRILVRASLGPAWSLVRTHIKQAYPNPFYIIKVKVHDSLTPIRICLLSIAQLAVIEQENNIGTDKGFL